MGRIIPAEAGIQFGQPYLDARLRGHDRGCYYANYHKQAGALGGALNARTNLSFQN
jgi:hypothetical protein